LPFFLYALQKNGQIEQNITERQFILLDWRYLYFGFWILDFGLDDSGFEVSDLKFR